MVETARRLQNLFLICGILASLLYGGNDILTGTLRAGYSFTWAINWGPTPQKQISESPYQWHPRVLGQK
jgi:hypothetical protein